MNSDFRLSIGYFRHPKIQKLKRRCGSDGVLAHVQLLSFAAQERPTGELTNMDLDDIAIACDYAGEAEPLVTTWLDLRLLDRAEDGTLSIHDWSEHNTWASGAKNRSQSAKTAAENKWGQQAAAAAPAPAPDKPKTNAKKRAQRLSEARAKGTHTEEEWEAMKAQYNLTCLRCGRREPEVKIVKDHITPIYMGGSDALDNLQPLCKSCNSSKGPDCTDYRTSAKAPVVSLETPAASAKTAFERLPNACGANENACGTPAAFLETPTLILSSPSVSSPSESLPSVPLPSEANPTTTTSLPSAEAASSGDNPPENCPEADVVVASELRSLGVSENIAALLVERKGCEACRKQIEWLPSRIKDREGTKQAVRDPAAALVKAIEDGYAVPASYSQGKRHQADQEHRARQAARRNQEARGREEAERRTTEAGKAKMFALWNQLPPDRQTAVSEEATRRFRVQFSVHVKKLDELGGDPLKMSVGARLHWESLRDAVLLEQTEMLEQTAS